MKKTKGTVHIIDDDPQMRESLELLVKSVELRAKTYVSAEDFLERFSGQETPGCLVLDIRMKEMSGMGLLDVLVARGERLPVIMITGYGDVQSAVHAMKAGAFDFIEKPFNRQVLLEKIHAAIDRDGSRLHEQHVVDELLRRIERLTDREREVLDHMLQGENSKKTGVQLGITIKTVLKHRARVLKKLKVQTLVELIHVAYRAGIIEELSDSPKS